MVLVVQRFLVRRLEGSLVLLFLGSRFLRFDLRLRNRVLMTLLLLVLFLGLILRTIQSSPKRMVVSGVVLMGRLRELVLVLEVKAGVLRFGFQGRN